jgi:tetratricopeptide (TPR) repeat protein
LVGPEQLKGLAEVTAELANVRAAWQSAIDQNRFDFIHWSLESAWNFYEIKSWFHEGEEIFRQAAEALAGRSSVEPDDRAEVQHQRLLAQLLIRQGWFCMRLARFDQAQHLLERGLSLARQFQDHLETGRALHHLGVVTILLGQYTAAQQLLEESVAVYRQYDGSHFDLGSALGTLGIALTRMGRFAEAKPAIEEGIFYYRQTGNPRAIALNYSFLGGFSIQTGDYRQAIPLLHEGLTFQKMIDDRVMIRMSQAWLGEIHEMLGEYDEARQQYEESLLISQGNGDWLGMAIASLNLGRLNVTLGQEPQAKNYLQAGLKLAKETQYMPLMIDGLISIAMLLAHIGDKQRALDILIPTLNHPAGEPQMRARAEQLLARLTDVPPAEIMAKGEAMERIEEMVTELLTADGFWREKSSNNKI